MQDGYGFGYKRLENGKLIRKENNFDIDIGQDVDIGLYSCIDKGSYRNTVIGEGTKIDNLVHIAHNAIIGKHCLIVAGTIIGGSAEIGDFCFIGMNSSIKDHVKIGKHVIVGAGSVVIHDVEDYDIVAGNPAKSVKDKVTLTPEQIFQLVGYVPK